jgi:hypothetical protein
VDRHFRSFILRAVFTLMAKRESRSGSKGASDPVAPFKEGKKLRSLCGGVVSARPPCVFDQQLKICRGERTGAGIRSLKRSRTLSQVRNLWPDVGAHILHFLDNPLTSENPVLTKIGASIKLRSLGQPQRALGCCSALIFRFVSLFILIVDSVTGKKTLIEPSQRPPEP